MAQPSVTTDQDTIDDADSATGWTGGSLDNDSEVQGTGCIGSKVSGATVRFIYTIQGGDPIASFDFSVGGADEGRHIYVWGNCLTPTLDLKSNGGLAIVVGDGTNQGEWYVGGDGSEADDPYRGGWKNFVIDPARDFDNIVAGTWTLAGNPAQLTAVTEFGLRVTTVSTIMGNFNNGLVDAIRVGKGLQLVDGETTDAGEFQTFLDADEGTVNNKYGVIASRSGVFFVQGQLTVGRVDKTDGPTVFRDSGQIVVFEDAPVASDLYEVIVQGDTTFQLGDKIGSGSTATSTNPVIMSSAVSTAAFAFTAEDFNIANLLLYGAQFVTARQISLGSATQQLGKSGSTIELVDCLFGLTQQIVRRIGADVADVTLVSNKITFPTVSTPSLRILDTLGHDQDRFAVIGGYGLSSDQPTVTSQSYVATQSNQDVEIDPGFTDGQVWTFIDPDFSENADAPKIDWFEVGTDGVGEVREEFSYALTVINPDGSAVSGASIHVYEATDDDFPVDNITDTDGMLAGQILSRTWVDGASGDSPTETEGPFTERVLKYGKTPVEQAIAVSAAIAKQVTLVDDPGITISESEALSLSTTDQAIRVQKLTNPDSVLAYVLLGTDSFVAGGTLTGGTSGATGTISEVVEVTSTTGKLVLTDRNGIAYDDNEVISAGSASARVDINTDQSEQRFTWEIDCDGASLSDVYHNISARSALSPHEAEFDTMLKTRVQLLLRSGDSYTTEAASSEGVILINRGAGTVTFMTADDGTTYTPPTSVTLELTNVVVGSQCYIEDANGVVLMNEVAVSSTVTEPYTYQGDIAVIVRVRKASAAPKYLPVNTGGTITVSGLSIQINQTLDTINT